LGCHQKEGKRETMKKKKTMNEQVNTVKSNIEDMVILI
jgi:hypothetical protein